MTSRFLLRSRVSMRWLLAATCFLGADGLIFAQVPSAGHNQDQLTGVDGIIALVQANMSEAFVMKRIKREGKVYNLTAADLVKLQKAGVSEKIIEFMMDRRSNLPPLQQRQSPIPQPRHPQPNPQARERKVSAAFLAGSLGTWGNEAKDSAEKR